MQTADAYEKLASIGQQHILKYADRLTSDQLQQLLKQIETLDVPTFLMQQNMLLHPEHHEYGILEAIQDYSLSGNIQDYETGVKLISEGKVGCLIVAGGQGTRLKFDGPKGAFPISIVKNKSLYQLFSEKTIAAGKRAGKLLPLAIMTSPLNHQQTVDFFEHHHFFGLNPGQVTFFSQHMLPMLNDEGNLFLEKPNEMAVGPDGNGSTLKHFYESGIWQEWKKIGVEYLNFILVDNALADPFDAELIGYHHRLGGEITIKSTQRQNPDEKVGILVKENGKVIVIEYTEMPKNEQKALEKGLLKHQCANLSLFSFDMAFVQQAAHSKLPLHLAHKKAPTVSETGMVLLPSEPNGWKFEEFIFDLLTFAKQVNTLVYPREQCFAPLKNSEGDGSPETVKKALQARDRQIFSQITGKEPAVDHFELSQEFYYPTKELLEKWRGKDLPN